MCLKQLSNYFDLKKMIYLYNVVVRRVNVVRGFTLIELMIVVTIIGIIASIAIPSFQNYLLRAKISESYNMIGALRTSQLSYYVENNRFVTHTSTGPVLLNKKILFLITPPRVGTYWVDPYRKETCNFLPTNLGQDIPIQEVQNIEYCSIQTSVRKVLSMERI